MTSDTYVHVSFITLGNEGDGDYEWISHGTSARRLTDNLSSLRKCVIRNIREKKTNVEHLLDLIDLDFFLVRKLVSSATGFHSHILCSSTMRYKGMEPT